ncbi:hypothetical protein UPYG_G00158470 [Umbra pygmaea]|uniref:Fibronectin type-III domain-containing protein n=1 Tax=Umbra pygmaea TaxID=75934 RepID=A0ABD0WYY2_UMBPY
MFVLKCVFSSWILCEVLTQALSELCPRGDVRLDAGVRWSPSTDRPGVKYTVQYRTCGNGPDKWQNVSECVQTELTTCNAMSGLGFVMVRVRAQDGNRNESVQNLTPDTAMSCSPEVNLKSLPGRLSIHWTRNNELHDDFADHFQYRVSHGREGEQLKINRSSQSSMPLEDLEVGERYCVQVQYECYGNPFGTPSPLQCASFLESEPQWRRKVVVISLVIAGLLFVMVGVVGYLLYKNHEKIKQLIQSPQLRIPEHVNKFLLKDFTQEPLPLAGTLSLCEEQHDVISIVLPEDDQSDTCASPAASDEEQDYNLFNGVDSSSASLVCYEKSIDHLTHYE